MQERRVPRSVSVLSLLQSQRLDSTHARASNETCPQL